MRKRFRAMPVYVAAVVCAVIFALPVLTLLSGSFMSTGELLSYFKEGSRSFSFIPQKITVFQYYDVLIGQPMYLKMFWNSVLIALSISMLSVVISIAAGYAFAKERARFKNRIFFLYVLVMLMPFQVTLLSNYLLIKWLGLYDSYLAIILPGGFAPFGVFLMRQYIRALPDELLEAAALETRSTFKRIIHIVLPECRHSIAALFVLLFAENWNMVEQPLILLETSEKMSLSVTLNSMQGDSMALFGGAVIYMIPIIILFLYFESHIIDGLGKMRLH